MLEYLKVIVSEDVVWVYLLRNGGKCGEGLWVLQKVELFMQQ
jgi:hypothetical protein